MKISLETELSVNWLDLDADWLFLFIKLLAIIEVICYNYTVE